MAGPPTPRRRSVSASGPSTLIKDHLAGGASRLAALLLTQILPVFSVVAPCHPGAALRDLVLVQRGRATSDESQHDARMTSPGGTQHPVRFCRRSPSRRIVSMCVSAWRTA